MRGSETSILAVRAYWVYILTNRSETLYTGMTNDLVRRLAEHRAGAGFTGRYAIHRLVYAEEYPTAADAIAREKQIKGWTRARKVALVNGANPRWRDLAPDGDS